MQTLNALNTLSSQVQTQKNQNKKQFPSSDVSFKDMVEESTAKNKSSREISKSEKNDKSCEYARKARYETTSEVEQSENLYAETKNTAEEENLAENQVTDASVKESSEEIPGKILQEKPLKNLTKENLSETAESDPAVQSVSFSIDNAQLEYLKTRESTENNNGFSLENIEEYTGVKTGEDILLSAQTMSVEEPEKFLEVQNFAQENISASNIDFSAMENFEVPSNENEASSGSTGKKEDKSFFKLEVTSKDGSKTEAKSMFDKIFTVSDERSIEQKIVDFSKEVKISTTNDGESSLNLTMSLNDQANQNILSTNNQSAGAQGSVFQEMFNQQIETSVPEFVKAGRLVLRDNNSGSVNMILKPESLGNVKISLNVSDKVITGQITVNSKEAYEAFKENLENLKQAFQDSGFESASLNLSLANDNSGSSAFAQNERQEASNEFFSNKVYGNYTASAEDEDASLVGESRSYSSGDDSRFSVVA